MSVNWTGSGSFLLHRQRRKHNATGPRRPFAIVETDSDEWLTNTRGGGRLPSPLTSSPPPEPARGAVRQPSRERTDTLAPNAEEHHRQAFSQRPRPWSDKRTRQRTMQQPSYRELRRWLLSKPDWSGASKTQDESEQDVQESQPKATVPPQPKPAPILDRSNHSK